MECHLPCKPENYAKYNNVSVWLLARVHLHRVDGRFHEVVVEGGADGDPAG